MDDELTSIEIETLWRLADQPAPATPENNPPSAQFASLRLRVQAAMVELVLRKLYREAATTPRREDLLVLLASAHPRLRTLGIRLSGLL